MSIPKTIVISIDTHGFNYLTQDLKQEIVDIKDKSKNNNKDLNIYKINVAFPGVINISDFKTLKSIFTKMSAYISKNGEKLNEEPEVCINNLVSILKTNYDKMVYELDKNKTLRKETKFNDYLCNYQHAFTIEKAGSNFNTSQIKEKGYALFTEEETENINRKAKYYEYFNKAIIMNLGNIDILDTLKQYLNVDVSVFYLSEIIDLCYNLPNVENVIIIDNTCSNFKYKSDIQDVMIGLDARTTRRLRREMLINIL
ncbi:MAG: hypothetical protein QM539_10450 [Alphaproteobacteria bacterium]|nr:hypothetical protein [Alphaproteobacteria bacterium]